MNKTGKNGIIFGKFYPLHIGHVDFIQRASGYVDKIESDLLHRLLNIRKI